MFTLYGGGNTTTWADMTPEERKIFLIIIGIMVVALAIYLIYDFIKKKKKENKKN